jgi:hypothetical protein
MRAYRSTTPKAIFAAALLAALAGCAAPPQAPNVRIMPGPGKSFEAFQYDQAGCKNYASDQVGGQAESSNRKSLGTAAVTTVGGAAVGALLGSLGGNMGTGAAIGAGAGLGAGALMGAGSNSNEQGAIQQRYDNAFAQCMYTRGHQVPGYASQAGYGPAPVAYSAGPDPLVRATQSELMRLGYMQGPADGLMGSATRGAIAQYEQYQGLPANGMPSPNLLHRLQSTPR